MHRRRELTLSQSTMRLLLLLPPAASAFTIVGMPSAPTGVRAASSLVMQVAAPAPEKVKVCVYTVAATAEPQTSLAAEFPCLERERDPSHQLIPTRTRGLFL